MVNSFVVRSSCVGKKIEKVNSAMDTNTPRNTKISLWQKIALVILGVFLTLILIETGLRLGGLMILSLQEYRNITSARQKGTYLIMCLGESTTADGPDAYPGQLENILNQHDIGIKFAVVNKGAPAINTQYILKHLQENLDKYHPDMVVTMMGINDKYIKYYEGIQDANTRLFDTFKTYRFARFIWENILDKAKRHSFYKVEVHTGSGRADNARGWLYREKGKNLQDTDAYAALGWLYMQERKYRQAKGVFQQAINLNSSNSLVYYGDGLLHKGGGEYIQAEEAFKKAISLDPANDTAYIELGWIYIHTNNYAKAEGLFKAAIRSNPKSEKMYRALIELYRQIGDNRSVAEYSMLKSKLKLPDDSSTDLTRRNYLELKKILDQRKIKLVCVQYPVRALCPLKKIFERQDGVLFVDNEDIFKDALQQAGYSEYFIDMFAGDFGHCTEKGNKLLAENIANVILKEVFNK